MDQRVAFHLSGSLQCTEQQHESPHCEVEIHSHALDCLDVLEGHSVPCVSISDREIDVATGGANVIATSASPAAGPSSASQRPGNRRSVSITDQWLSPSERRKSSGAGVHCCVSFF